MKQLTCEMCGSTDLLKQDGVFVCQSCGCKYSTEEARKMMVEGTVEVAGTVKVDNTGLLESYLQMSENALDSSNYAEAENYANKIIEIDPKSYRAWFIKGKAAGWQTTGRNNRYPESIVNWINAYQFAPEDKKDALADKIEAEAMNISIAILQMEINSFINYRSQENKNDIDNALSLIEKQLGTLKAKTEIEVYTDSFKTILARSVNGGAISASNAAYKDFGPNDSDKSKYNWDRFTSTQDWCLSLLDKAYGLTFDDDLCLTICNNYITIAEQCRDSCSYAYSNGIYVRDFSFTQQAKNVRTKAINEWKTKQAKHDPAIRKSNCEQAQKMVADSCDAAEKQMAIAQYWQEHSSEKVELEREKAVLEERLSQLQAEISANANKTEMDRLDSQISNLKSQMASLGFFKGKEKKALQAQIDDLNSKKSGFESSWDTARKQNDDAQSIVKDRIRSIEEEFTKDRGTVKIVPTRCISLFNNGKFVPTAMQLVEYNRAVLPDGITVKGDGENAVENYTKSVMIKAKAMLALFSALSGNGDSADNLDLSYEDKPNQIKAYRINFAVNGEDSDVSSNFMGKTVNSVIEDNYYYELEEEKTPKKVANFVRIVSASILGICPDIDMNMLQKAITEVAFGIKPEQSLEADGIIITVTGNSKSNPKVTLAANAE